ncbi:MAG: AbrB family transcriptional regulator [Pseudomonadota bacterium]
MTKIKPMLIAVAIGLIGATLATLAGIPAGALVGSALAVSVAAALHAPLAMNDVVRNLAITIIGVTLGAGIDSDTLAVADTYALSLVLMILSLLITLLAGSALLRLFFNTDRDTSVLATCPGTLAYAVTMAIEGRGDATTVMVLQVLRLLLLVSTVPLLAALLGEPVVSAVTPTDLSLPAMAILLLLTMGLGAVGSRFRIPVAYLIAGILISAVAHAADIVEGRPPPWVLFIGFTITGTTLGIRLKAIARADLYRLAGAGVALVACTILISVAFASLTAYLTGLSLNQVWIAYAPGGVEAMAAIGLALGYDPAYVALHHFARIVFLLVLVPFILGRNAPT